ncbi:MAG: hypothetical protein QUS33_10995 [Dehalococcoidia bacterium]|nr:hypothetical protein [Dehalococcoidia bacterium]
MRKLLCALAFIAVLSLSLTVACANESRDASDRVDLVPQTADLIGHIELGQVMGDDDIAGIYAALPKEEGDPRTLEEAVAKAIDMVCLDLRSFDECWIFGNLLSLTVIHTDYAAAILKGTFDESMVLNCAKLEFGEGLTLIDYKGHTIYTGVEEETGLAILSDDLLAAGSVAAIKDVIAVQEGSAPALDGELLEAYEDLDDVLFKLAAAVPPGLAKQKVQEMVDGDTSPPALDALDDLEVLSMTVGEGEGGVRCDSQLFFSNKDSANDVKGWIPLLPLMIGGIEIPEESVIQNPENILALLPQVLDNGDYDCRVKGRRLTIGSDLTAADIEAMTKKAGPTGLSIGMAVDMGTLTSKGLDVSVHATVNNNIGMKFDIGDLRLAAVSRSGHTYIEETVAGATIGANSAAEFRHGFTVPLELVSETGFVITADTTAKARGMTMPLKSSIDLTIPDLDSIVVIPVIDLGVDIGNLTPDGLEMRLQATVPNCNPFGIDVGDLQIVAKDQSGGVILKAMLTGSAGGLSIAPNSSGTLSGDLLMPLEVISEPALLITVETQAGLAGINLPIAANMKVAMPDIESLAAVPEISLGVDIEELTTGGLLMGLQATVPNSNPFGIDVADLEIVARGQSGNVILASTMAGCSVGAGATGELSGDLLLPLSVLSESAVTISVQTEAGFAGLTMPVGGSIVITIPDLESLVAVPEMSLGVDFGKLTSKGLYLDLQATIANTNPFAVEVGDLEITGRGGLDAVLFSSSMKGCSIGAGSTGMLSGEILVPLAAVNETAIVIEVETRAGIEEITLPLSAQITVNMPDIGSLVAVPKIKIWTKPSWECGFPLPGLRIDTATTITNKADFALKVGDIWVCFFNSNDELVHETKIPGGTINAHSSKKFCSSVILSASEYLNLICGEDFTVQVSAKGGIAGVDAMFPVQASMTTVLSSLFKVPDVDMDVDFGELTRDGLRVKLETILCNPNLFGVDVEDLRVVIKNKIGDVLHTCDLDDFVVGPDCTGSLLGDLLVPLDILDESKIVICIEGKAGFSGVSMPFNGKIAVKMPKIRNLVEIPEAELDVDFWELTPDGLHMGLQANVDNPNPFGIDIGDLLIVAKTRSGDVILSSSIRGCSIQPNSAGTISGDLLMPLGVLDRSTVVIKIQTEAGFAEIALPFSAKMTVKMPDIRDLFAIPDVSLGVAFGDLTPDGLPMTLQATITNPNQFGIDLGDLRIAVTGQSGDVILNSSAGGCSLEPALATTLSADLLLPLEVLDDAIIKIVVETEAGFAGFELPFSEELVLINMPDAEDIAGT